MVNVGNPLCIAVVRKNLSVGVAGHESPTRHESTKGQQSPILNPQVEPVRDLEARKAASFPVETASMWPPA